jgi:hypothetical protein
MHCTVADKPQRIPNPVVCRLFFFCPVPSSRSGDGAKRKIGRGESTSISARRSFEGTIVDASISTAFSLLLLPAPTPPSITTLDDDGDETSSTVQAITHSMAAPTRAQRPTVFPGGPRGGGGAPVPVLPYKCIPLLQLGGSWEKSRGISELPGLVNLKAKKLEGLFAFKKWSFGF